MLRPVELSDLRDDGFQRAPAADGNDDGFLIDEITLHDLRAGDGELAVDLLARIPVDRDDLADRESVAVAELLCEREAIGDAVIHSHADQVLFHRERDEPLRHRTRDLQFLCDLVLGVAGDVIQPRCAGC